jgi:CheY-like chemotaxis protein
MSASFEAFLSYTRIDDEFFGGAITNLRRSLELGVQVVTGEREFKIFQDVDGIEFGERWRDKLDRAISEAQFLIPVVTPCFLRSEACRDELTKFLQMERTLHRNDLVLPLYFVTTPSLESKELMSSDPLAIEISERQRHDWRKNAESSLDSPETRRAVRLLAEKMAQAMASRQANVRPVSSRPIIPQEIDPEPPKNSIKGKKVRRENQKKQVLWVDDRPDNNHYERRALEAYNVEFSLATSTGQALGLLRKQKFDAIISDMGRPPDSRAGYTLLEAIRKSGDLTPFFIYAGSKEAEHLKEALSRGAQGTTNIGEELIEDVLKAIND